MLEPQDPTTKGMLELEAPTAKGMLELQDPTTKGMLEPHGCLSNGCQGWLTWPFLITFSVGYLDIRNTELQNCSVLRKQEGENLKRENEITNIFGQYLLSDSQFTLPNTARS